MREVGSAGYVGSGTGLKTPPTGRVVGAMKEAPSMDDKPTKQDQQDLDEALEDTFPASDPPANSGTTGPGGDQKPA